jgi:hypothetical protein
MKVAQLLLAAATALALTESDILERLEALERANREMKAENAEIKATLNATSAGVLKVFNAEDCPLGWVEFNKTQGYMLTGRPKGGQTGTTINRPMDVGEKGRSPEHSHEVGVEDLGHTHETVVNDPGHSHTNAPHSHHSPLGNREGGTAGPAPNEYHEGAALSTGPASVAIDTNKTGIIIDALPAKSNIQVSLTTNKDGEGYPLVYVLICQRVLRN